MADLSHLGGRPFARSSRPAARPPISRAAYCLLAAVAAYLVVPVLEVPLWGLSVSTPIFCFIALDLLSKQPPSVWFRYEKWILLALAFWAGQFLSLSGNVLTGNMASLSFQDAVWLIRFAYWMVVFAVTTVIVSRMNAGPRIARVLGVSVFVLAALRLLEGLLFGTWGTSKTYFMTPNMYGWLFSAFTPFALWLAVSTAGWRRWTSCAGLVLVAAVIAGNGSRSSWITLALSGVLLGLLLSLTNTNLHLRAQPSLLTVAVLSSMAFWAVPDSAWSKVQARFSTLENLKKDKSYAIRVLMAQKALLLFRENPLWGIGVGRFPQTIVPLEIPPLLRNKPQKHYDGRSAHNSYAGLLAETGLAGTIPFVLLLLVLALQGLRATIRRSRRGEAWAIPVYVGFVAMSAHFCTLYGLNNTSTWFLFGLLAAIIQRDDDAGLREAPRPAFRSVRTQSRGSRLRSQAAAP